MSNKKIRLKFQVKARSKLKQDERSSEIAQGES